MDIPGLKTLLNGLIKKGLNVAAGNALKKIDEHELQSEILRQLRQLGVSEERSIFLRDYFIRLPKLKNLSDLYTSEEISEEVVYRLSRPNEITVNIDSIE